ncbi:C protein alpha-antigen [Streptococcus dysgalactiae subsp. equisimilis]|uniref:C protein alpha-antigen n=1 Tax=Streptococcus dysgalactiae subsp. equisimilis TaxID=119602 RepID=A0A9X8T0J3_STREQ|nr:alpha-like surface protein [Streptococcus dysgalactiae]SQF67447.1 C protein alpha-antigen [Streptococcus dysgalactiae subsp. equisimilis]VEF06008.1 C protein alpha-antigen [Streptococcus dysgalactiae subsp. equisimilis]
MFRRSKNNSYATSQTKQRFSIKKFKFGAASVLIGISFLGGFTQGQFNISTNTVFAAEVIPGSAATLNTSMTKNMQKGNAYIDLYDVKNGLIDPQNLIVLNPSSYSANYYIKQGAKYYSNPSEITTTGSATITFNILDETGNPHKKADGQIDIVSVNLTIYDSTALRNRIDEVINNANDPKWSDGSRDEVLTGLEIIKKDIDNNPKTQSDIDNKITEVTNLEKILVPRIPDADKNDPVGKDQTVKVGEQPDPTKSLEAVPAGSTVAYKEPVDTKTPGEKNAIVVVTYPDKSTDEVPVKVTVVDPRTDAEKNDPAGKDQTVKVGEQPDPTKSLEAVPAGSTVAYKEPVDTKTPGEKNAIVVVTYPDKSTDEVPVKVTVVDPRTDAEKNDPAGKDQTVKVGEQPDPTKSLEAVPAGSTVAYKDPVDTKTPGEKDAVVVVTYPDKSTDEVPVKVTVVVPRTDADKNDPAGKDQQVNVGETPKAEDSIGNLSDLPKGTTVAFETPVDTATPGDKPAKVVVTYPDGSKDTVTVTIHVTPTPDKDKYDPTGGETTVPQGTPISDEEITGLVKISEGSNGVPKVVGNRPNTDVPGDYKVTVEVTYPDGSKDTVTVTIHVTPTPDKDKYDPTGGETTVPQGTPISDEEITGLVKISEGSNGVPKVVGNRPNTDVPGDYKVTVEVTYPDGSKDTVTVTIHVTPTPDKDKYDPTGGETTVPQGTPVSDKEITDLVKIPDGSKGVPTVVGDRPDTNVPGDHKVTVDVTYPDGTKDTVEVTVHVTPKPVPDKDKYDPTGGETTVPQGTPISDEEITGLVKIPEGSNGVPKVVGDRPNTDVPGDYKVTVEVTYPDGTKDTVEVTVHVTPKPVPDKDKYDPTGGETTVPQGTPISDEEITGLVKIPEGSNGVPKVVGDRPNTDVPGDYKVTVEVTYPDGSKDTVEVTVHVTPKPVPDKDKYDPTGKAQQVNGKGNKLPATGENATPFFNVAALTIISSVGLLSVSKKKED